MAAAYAAHPERFTRAVPQPPALPTTAVWISPPARRMLICRRAYTRLIERGFRWPCTVNCVP